MLKPSNGILMSDIIKGNLSISVYCTGLNEYRCFQVTQLNTNTYVGGWMELAIRASLIEINKIRDIYAERI